jgi:hypothetical protein
VIPAELAEAVKERSLLLFAGAGVSAGLGLPTFARLIDILASELFYDSDVFRRLGSYEVLAEYFESEKGGIGSLRSRLDLEWHDPGKSVEESYVHRLIPELQAPLIYTTNYDRWLERAFERLRCPYDVVTSVSDLKRLRPDVPQIVKFHGDFSDDASIVLTEESYFRRLEFETPLDIKLRADSLSRSMLFIGYSFSDVNVRLLMYKLDKLWQEASRPRPRSYIVLPRPNPVQEVVLRRRGVEPIVTSRDDPSEGLAEFLRDLVLAAHGVSVENRWP